MNHRKLTNVKPRDEHLPYCKRPSLCCLYLTLVDNRQNKNLICQLKINDIHLVLHYFYHQDFCKLDSMVVKEFLKSISNPFMSMINGSNDAM